MKEYEVASALLNYLEALRHVNCDTCIIIILTWRVSDMAKE